MYDGDLMFARTIAGEKPEFPITIRIYQGSVLSHYLFAFVMGGLSKNIQDDILGVCSVPMILSPSIK